MSNSVQSEKSTVKKAVSLNFTLLNMDPNGWMLVISLVSTRAGEGMDVGLKLDV